MKLYQLLIREFEGSQYGEGWYPFENDVQEFEWWDTSTTPDISEVEALLMYLEYDTEGIKFTPTGVEGIGVTGEHLDLVISFTDNAV